MSTISNLNTIPATPASCVEYLSRHSRIRRVKVQMSHTTAPARAQSTASAKRPKWNKQITNVRHIWYIIKIYDERVVASHSDPLSLSLALSFVLFACHSAFRFAVVVWLREILLLFYPFSLWKFGKAIISGIKPIGRGSIVSHVCACVSGVKKSNEPWFAKKGEQFFISPKTGEGNLSVGKASSSYSLFATCARPKAYAHPWFSGIVWVVVMGKHPPEVERCWWREVSFWVAVKAYHILNN